MKTCRLCLNEVTSLEDSHIISECFYENLYDAKHRTVPITTDPKEKLEFIQKGYREKLLCKVCEARLSKWEKIVHRGLKEIGNEKSEYLKFDKSVTGELRVSGIRYDSFKRGLLSIFWRMSVSSVPMFKKYQFGIHSEKMRGLLIADTVIPTLVYPLHIRKCFLEDEFVRGLMMTFPRKRYLGVCSFYRLVLDGFVVGLFLTENAIFSSKEKYFLQEDGSLEIKKVNLEKWRESGAFDRLDDPDVEEKMGRLIEK